MKHRHLSIVIKNTLCSLVLLNASCDAAVSRPTFMQKPAANKPALPKESSETEQKALILCREFLDTKHHENVSWQSFIDSLIILLRTDKRYIPMSNSLQKVRNCTSAAEIILALSQHKKQLPKELTREFESFSAAELLGIINKRIAGNL
jgi:hypothetical protein